MPDAIALSEPSELLHFQVAGKYGPMTLTFRHVGRHPCAGGEITDEMAGRLTQAEVEEWYVQYNYPVGGHLRTTHRGRYCGLFEYIR